MFQVSFRFHQQTFSHWLTPPLAALWPPLPPPMAGPADLVPGGTRSTIEGGLQALYAFMAPICGDTCDPDFWEIVLPFFCCSVFPLLSMRRREPERKWEVG